MASDRNNQRQKGRRRGPPRQQATAEQQVSGLNACRAVFARRPHDILKIYLTEDRLESVRDILKWCAAERKGYRVVSDADIGKITQSTHHEGICVLCNPLLPMPVDVFLKAVTAAEGPIFVVCLDRVENPHNLGAIIRVAAHFGVFAILQCGEEERAPALSGAVYRTAEGGLENVPVVRVDSGEKVLKQLQDIGFSLVATSSHEKHSLYRAEVGKRIVLLLGSEATGLADRLASMADTAVSIPGTGAVESLNVACATSTILGELWRRMHA